MAEESEKRFHAIMDKLFQAPSSPNSNSKSTRTTDSASVTAGVSLRGRKRPLAVVDLKPKGVMIEDLGNASGAMVQSPMCRPWDREDLLKRLATFKSMTWFAKPEVVSAINCARRGWVNVDLDIIACKSCGARLLFSTPSSWAQQQVEKAASVFSLKLNNGHKLLCPWVDNACDEKLAQFPPSSTADLVDDYKKRCASLFQLMELPVISSTAIDDMRSPLLEHFLKSPSTLENVYRSDDVSERGFGDEREEDLPVLYYQAQKLTSLCGWEPRLLPYIVDCKNPHDQSIKDGTLPNSSIAASITLYSSGTNVEPNEDPATENKQYDHTSVVLHCRLCGARVGLWAFCTTPRPAEFIRLVGHTEPNDENSPAPQMDNNTSESGQQTPNATSSNKTLLNLTIAGGPPPAEQNFRPTISLPVVGQNLRTRFSSAFGERSNSGNNISEVNLVEGNLQKSTVNYATSLNNVLDTGKDSKKLSAAKSMEFDLIKQHRHFCPWIASSGKSAPGWKQTLSALERQKEFFYPLQTTQDSSSLIEVEDPVGSVKKLLTPPSAKRKKLTHGSS